jgi:putative transcriptional regulator
VIHIRLVELLQARGRTRYWLAKQAGMTPIAISDLCAGKTQRIKFSTISAICDVLDCQPNDWLVNERDGADPSTTSRNGISEKG